MGGAGREGDVSVHDVRQQLVQLELCVGVGVALEAVVTGLMSHLSLIVMFTDLKILYICACFCRLYTTSLFSLFRKLHDI